MKKQKKRQRTATDYTKPAPFVEHLHELRRRIYWVAICIALWGGAIYAVQQRVVNILLRPAHGQHFIYTSPGGGIDFLFKVCIYGGLVISLPVVVYNILRFCEPLIDRSSRRFVFVGSFISGLLALAGVVFGYFVGLPAALHFLLHQFTSVQIQPLVTIQSYLNFVIVYMVGSAMLFQLPLLLIFINRIKPLKPKRLLHYERWVILAAFVLAGLMNPTPNIFSQLLVAGPFIVMYQISIVLISIINRPRRSAHIRQLLEQDAQFYLQRQNPSSIPNTTPIPRSIPTLFMPNAVPSPQRQLKPIPQAQPRTSLQPQIIHRPIQRPARRTPASSGAQQRFMDFIPSSPQSLTN